MADIAGMVKGLRAERARALKDVARLGQAIAVLDRVVHGSGKIGTVAPRKKRTMSAAARRRIAAAQRARWAKWKQSQGKKAA